MTLEENLLRFRRPEGKWPLVLGHRGARKTHPENTMLAFEQALAQGADGVELDVRMTSDGALFISHDPHLVVRGTSRPALLHMLSKSQASELRLQSGEKLPSLDEVLDFQRSTGCLMNIELKGDLPSPLYLAKRVIEKLRAHGGSGLLVSSFHPLQVRAVRQALPEIPVGFLFHKDQVVFRRFPPYRLLGASAVHPESVLATTEDVVAWKKANMLVNVWTVNEPANAIALADRGVDALISDAPGEILAALAAEMPESRR